MAHLSNLRLPSWNGLWNTLMQNTMAAPMQSIMHSVLVNLLREPVVRTSMKNLTIEMIATITTNTVIRYMINFNDSLFLQNLYSSS